MTLDYCEDRICKALGIISIIGITVITITITIITIAIIITVTTISITIITLQGQAGAIHAAPIPLQHLPFRCTVADF